MTKSFLLKSATENIMKSSLPLQTASRSIRKEKPILLLAGPSGAGKTTTALKIEEILDSRGIHTHTISMDDYFLPSDSFTAVIGEDGKPDYESPDRIDRKLLYEHMEKINSGEEVVLPKFEFSEQCRRDGERLETKQKRHSCF